MRKNGKCIYKPKYIRLHNPVTYDRCFVHNNLPTQLNSGFGVGFCFDVTPVQGQPIGVA